MVSIIESQSKIDIEISWNTAYSHLSIWSALKKKKKKPSSRVQLAENELKLTTVQSYNRFLTSHPPICRPVTDEDLMLCSFSLVYKNAKAPATKVLCPFASDTSSAWEEAGWGKEGGGVVTREMLSGFVRVFLYEMPPVFWSRSHSGGEISMMCVCVYACLCLGAKLLIPHV